MKLFRITFTLLMIIPLLSACGAAPTKPANPPLRIAVNLWPGLYPAAIAQEEGFFAKHNVNVQLIYYDAYPNTYPDLVADKIDGLSVVIGDILPISTQKNIRFIFPIDASDGADMLIVGPTIKNASDLKGKRIGVDFGTYGELFVRTLLKQNGITPTDVTLVNIHAPDAAQAFPAKVDAVHTYGSYASDVLKQGGNVLFTSSQTPNLVMDMMVFSDKLVKERPEDIQAFTDAWFEAVDWMNTHHDQVPAIVTKVFGSGLKPEDIFFEGDKVFNHAEAKALMQPGKDSSSAYYITQNYIDFLATAGILTTKPKPEALIDPSFLK